MITLLLKPISISRSRAEERPGEDLCDPSFFSFFLFFFIVVFPSPWSAQLQLRSCWNSGQDVEGAKGRGSWIGRMLGYFFPLSGCLEFATLRCVAMLRYRDMAMSGHEAPYDVNVLRR